MKKSSVHIISAGSRQYCCWLWMLLLKQLKYSHVMTSKALCAVQRTGLDRK